MRFGFFATALLLASVALPAHAAAPAKGDPAQEKAALDLLVKSIGFRTVQGQGQVPAYAEYLAGVLKAAGFPAEDVVVTPRGETATLVARYRGTGKGKPILLSGHMDVVEAKREDWERDPFVAVVEKGYIYGRGSADNKAGVTVMVETLARLKREGFRPGRDLILALSGDEETDMATTAALAQELKGAELLLNSDAGGALLDEETGRPTVYGLQAGEKSYADFRIAFTNPGGHSSRPSSDNAIYDVARAIDAVAGYQFPAQINELTRATLKAAAVDAPARTADAMKRFLANQADADAVATLSADPEWIGTIRTTCVPTMLEGGHALNALPQSAAVMVNCRIFPGVSIDTVKAKLAELAGPKAKITVLGDPVASDASPLRPDVMAAVRKAIDARSPGLPIVPQMSSGATDSVYFRALGIPSYGVGVTYMKASDDFAHGLNERVTVESINGGLKQWYVLLKELAK
ncbi:M20/M25/M40 family metallo-hydrolase [Edaphosphingomonas haloaromaticamans]|uniref:Putative succinyl-diaminopimelate desuccinylase n=1 Tax=Edaphosphingomonas haloaromaticamans TaxID=653954 RepID=A0A1S1HDY4_9SPHN|nr:M20/M25/M40 family metallo-hydrolase [Sphingomonas haloaromaticamans]OHT20405.1 putative succinyl-diaminopimelate desuccinylase [Sphingomonas haloaromaticamans]